MPRLSNCLCYTIFSLLFVLNFYFELSISGISISLTDHYLHYYFVSNVVAVHKEVVFQLFAKTKDPDFGWCHIFYFLLIQVLLFNRFNRLSI